MTPEEFDQISFKHIDNKEIMEILYSEKYNYYIKRKKGGIQAAYFKTPEAAKEFIKQWLPRYCIGKITNDS